MDSRGWGRISYDMRDHIIPYLELPSVRRSECSRLAVQVSRK